MRIHRTVFAIAVTIMVFVAGAATAAALGFGGQTSIGLPTARYPGTGGAQFSGAPPGNTQPSATPSTAPNCSSGQGGPSGQSGFGPSGFSGGPSGQSAGAATTVLPAAASRVAAKIDPALVDINTVLSYQSAEAAGTGIVIGSNGLVLTNNHVIRGATSVIVTDLGTKRSYHGTVAGYDVAADVALVRLSAASHLQTAPLGSSKHLAKGTPVLAIGNACGLGGTPSVSVGTVTALGQSIVASDQLLGAERLHGLIQTDAKLQPGDSGGSLVAESSGKVIGVDTAGASGFSLQSSATQGYAVPIDAALAIARDIERGHASASVHVGPTAFLGVEVSSSAGGGPSGTSGGDNRNGNGVFVVAVVPGAPAARAGIASGDTILAIGGRAVTSPAQITDALLAKKPRQKLQMRYAGPDGAAHTANVALVTGPAQ
jgi:S1-C subfamily serine protease